jgi:hypothetical protein
MLFDIPKDSCLAYSHKEGRDLFPLTKQGSNELIHVDSDCDN